MIHDLQERTELCLLELESTLTENVSGNPTAWLERVYHVAGDLTQVLQEQVQAAKQDTKVAAKMNSDAVALPTLARQTDAVRESDLNLAEATYCLRADVRHLQERSSATKAEIDSIRQSARDLADAVAENRRTKNKLLMDAVNMDIGAGD